MNQRITRILLMAGLMAGAGSAQGQTAAASALADESASTAKTEERPLIAFSTASVVAMRDAARVIGLGREVYVYSVYWGLIKVGRATIGSPGVVHRQDRPAYRLLSNARTIGWVDTFYRVRDQNEAWLDLETFRSLGFSKQLSEGRFYRNETVLYHNDTAQFSSVVRKKSGKIVNEQGPMKPSAYDVMSALYWVRSQPLELGRSYSIDVNTRNDWPLAVHVNRSERVKVPAGEFDCLVVEPVLRDEGIFIIKGKSMHIWLTRDARRIPVLVKAAVHIGSVRAELEEIVYSDMPKPLSGDAREPDYEPEQASFNQDLKNE